MVRVRGLCFLEVKLLTWLELGTKLMMSYQAKKMSLKIICLTLISIHGNNTWSCSLFFTLINYIKLKSLMILQRFSKRLFMSVVGNSSLSGDSKLFRVPAVV